MTYRGRVKKGVVILDDPKALPEGTEVTVRPVKPRAKPAKAGEKNKAAKPQEKKRKIVRPGLVKFAGKAKGLPPDASRNLDHYLYGHPKR